MVEREHGMRPIYATRGLATRFAAGLVLVAVCTLLAVAAITMSGCGDSGDQKAPGRPDASATQQPDELWGRRFSSTAVTEGGEPRPLIQDTRVRVAFKRSKTRHLMGWSAGCNSVGAKVRVTADELHIAQITSTLIGCPPGRAAQDEWLSEFFNSNPRWRLSDSRLTLTSGGTVIELEEMDH
jgi:heat shock protein HslJ